MKIAFYKDKSHWLDRIIQWWTRGPYSHVELVIDGICYTSSKRDGGVRCKFIDLSDGHWDVFDIEGDKAQALAWFKEHDGQTYDIPLFLGLALGLTFKLTESKKTKKICSEAVQRALELGDIILTPNQLAKRMNFLPLKPL